MPDLKKIMGGLALILLAAAVSAQKMDGHKVIRYDGMVQSINGEKVHMRVNDGSTGDWTIAKDVRVFEGRAKVPLSRVKVGDSVVAEVSVEGTVYEFKITREKPGDRSAKSPKASAKPQIVTGRLVEIMPDGNIAVESHGKRAGLRIEPGTRIWSRKKEVARGELKIGQSVKVVMANGAATRVEILSQAKQK